MRRRELLAAGAGASLAGCGDLAGPDSRFEGEPCPTLTGRPTFCYHSTGIGIDALVLEPDREIVEEPDEPLRFTLHNRGFEPVSVSLTLPWVSRRVDGVWQVTPKRRQDSTGATELDPGGSLRIGLVTDRSDRLDDVDFNHLAAFGAGQFALVVGTASPRRYALARFEVEGEAMRTTAPERVRTEFSNGTLFVRESREWIHPDRRLTITYTECPDADDAFRIAPEVLARRWDLRAVAFLQRDDVDTVVVRAEDGYFRTAVEWLQAARVWRGSDRPYQAGGVTFTVSQRGG